MEKKKLLITKNMNIGEIAQKYPVVVEVMLKFGLHCVGCPVAASETIEQGAKGHGMDDEEIEEMLEEMNEKAKAEAEEDYSEFEENADEEE